MADKPPFPPRKPGGPSRGPRRDKPSGDERPARKPRTPSAETGGDRPYRKPTPEGTDRPYPRPRPQGTETSGADRPYKKPRPAGADDRPYKKPRAQGEDKPYRKPAAEGTDRPYARPRPQGAETGGDRPYRKPRAEGEDRPYRKPRAEGDDRPFKKPRGQGGDRPYGKPKGDFGREGDPSPDEMIYGLQALREALNAGRVLDKVLIDKENANTQVQSVQGTLRAREIPLQFVPRQALERLAPGRNHQGIVALLAAVAFRPLQEVVAEVVARGEVPLVVLLDGVTDVRNVGAIARSIEVLGGHALVVPAQGSARLGADAVKTSAGALHHLAVCRTPTVKQAIAELEALGVAVVALTEKADTLLPSADLTQPTCLLLGDESEGIQTSVLKLCSAQMAIPMGGQIGSLNVSVAAGVALYEAKRQRLG